MRKILFIIAAFLSLTVFGQSSLTFQFIPFDSTKIYIKYIDLKPFFSPGNKQLNDIAELINRTDTITLEDGCCLHLGIKDKPLHFDLLEELYAALKNKKGIIIYNGQIISSFYTKKVHRKRKGKTFYKGIYYIDNVTKKHFLTETIYEIGDTTGGKNNM